MRRRREAKRKKRRGEERGGWESGMDTEALEDFGPGANAVGSDGRPQPLARDAALSAAAVPFVLW